MSDGDREKIIQRIEQLIAEREDLRIKLAVLTSRIKNLRRRLPEYLDAERKRAAERRARKKEEERKKQRQVGAGRAVEVQIEKPVKVLRAGVEKRIYKSGQKDGKTYYVDTDNGGKVIPKEYAYVQYVSVERKKL